MDDVVTQLGLLLTQTRFARRALEDIERATARYASFAMTIASTAGAAFGSPPLTNGALRVHVVNIQDLTSSGGQGDFAGLLGGFGAFVGNLFGGVAGGTLGSITLAESLGTIDSIATRIERIIDKLGLGRGTAEQGAVAAGAAKAATASGTPPVPAAAGGQPEFVELLDSLRGKVDALTNLLRAANGQPPVAAGAGGSAVGAPDAERWRAWVDSVTAALDAATRLVGGLVVAVPTVVAGVSWLFDRLPDFRDAIVDTLRFVVRNVLVLTRAIAVLALETMAMVTRVLTLALRTIATVVDDVLKALFAALVNLLDGALDLGKALADAVSKTVKQLLDWLVPQVFDILSKLGQSNVFRLLDKLVDILPGLLLLAGHPEAAGKAVTKQKQEDPTPPKLSAPPVLAGIVQELTKNAKAATDKIASAAKQLVDDPTNALHQGLTDYGKKLDKAAVAESTLVGTNLDRRLKELGTAADQKANALLPQEPTGKSQNVWDRLRGQTAFHPIAAAYGQWLATGGLKQLLDSMTGYFAAPESRSDSGPSGSRGRTPVTGPVVQIDQVLVDIVPVGAHSDTSQGPNDTSAPAASLLSRYIDDRERIERVERLDDRRGLRGQRRPHVPIWDFATY